MNTSELEQRMKALLEEQEYHPTDASWDKMHEALHPPAARKVLFLLPVWKAAAAVALLAVTGLTGYLFLREEKTQPGRETVVSHSQPQNKQTTTSSADKNDTDQKTTQNTVQGNIPQLAKHRQAPSQVIIAAQAGGSDSFATAAPIAAQQDPISSPTPSKQPAIAGHDLPRQKQPADNKYAWIQDPQPVQDKKSLNLGLAANIGKPSLGNVQYNIGVVAHKDITAIIFAEANVSLASTQISHAERLAPMPGLGSSDPNDILGESYSRGKDVNYANNIIAVGFAPSIGIKATRHISLSVGGDLYKTLNRNLKLQEEVPAGLVAAESDELLTRNVTNWDAGIKAQLDYRLGKHMSVTTQYRQGLTQYILIDGKSIKNSVFNVGLKFYIGR